MSFDYNDPANSHALRLVNLEVRDHLADLAVQIVAAKYDLKTAEPNQLVSALRDEIETLHRSYHSLHL